MERLQETLIRLYQQHRVIFWYDEANDMAEQFNGLVLPDVEKIVVNNNEFAVKCRILRQQPDSKFLLYFNHAQPAHDQNWLLDLQLAGYLFRTDLQAQYMQEIGLDYHYHAFVSQHIEFFRSTKRRERLVRLGVRTDEKEQRLRAQMIAVVFGLDNVSLSDMLLTYAQAIANGPDERFGPELARYDLTTAFWDQVAGRFGYKSANPSIHEFIYLLFQANATFLSTLLGPESRILMNRWKVDLRFQESFQQLSRRISDDLMTESDLASIAIDILLEDDLFERVEQRIIHELARQYGQGSLSAERMEYVQKERRHRYWYGRYRYFYDALLHAVTLTSLIEPWANQPFDNLADGPERYTQQLYRVDQHYRKLLFAYRQTQQNSVLEPVVGQVVRIYANQWLLPLNQQWQRVIDQTTDWTFGPLQTQRLFFRFQLQPQLAKGRIFVVVSDALRYEWGRDFADRMQAEKRYSTELSYMVTGLPSYTQLGIASLLPHTTLSIQPGSDSVIVDGMYSQGTENRAKILAAHNGTAISAQDFMAMNANREGREWVKPYSVIYIYHNVIDRIGDRLATEQQVVDESERVLNELQEIIRKITNMNGVHIWITADHGFLYQQNPVDDADFLDTPLEGEIWKQARRYVVGRNLKAGNGFRAYEAPRINLSGDTTILLPKSLQRLRLSGSGSRYVHGGASLQEVVVPLLKISRRKSNTNRFVDIDIIRSSDRITTNIIPISFFQQEAIGDAILPRMLRVAFFANDGIPLSDQFTYLFDSAEPSERLREKKHRFQLTQKAGSLYNHQYIYLRLEEPIDNTGQWKEYKRFSYELMISFTNDFDDF